MKQLLLVLLVSLCLLGCSSIPQEGEISGQSNEPTAGSSKAAASRTGVTTGLSYSALGDSSNTTVSANASRSISSSNAGDNLFAFTFAGSVDAVQAVRELVATDPVLLDLQEELKILSASETPDPVRRDALRQMMGERMEAHAATVKAGGGDLSKLDTLVVFNWNHKVAGQEQKPLGEAEAKAAVEGIQGAIKAARMK